MRNIHVSGKRRLLKFLRKGSSEIIPFMTVLPLLLLFLYTLIDVIHAGGIRQRLEYTAYKGCRAAIVCPTYEKAVEEARDVIWNDLILSGEKIDFENMTSETTTKIDIIPAEGYLKLDSSDPYEDSLVFSDPSSITGLSVSPDAANEDNNKEENWKKGNYIVCSVTVKYKTFDVFSGNTKSASIAMMIESVTSDADTYPWFKDTPKGW